MRLLLVMQGAPGGVGRIERLLAAVWSCQAEVNVSGISRLASLDHTRGWSSVSLGRAAKLGWSLRVLARFVRTRPDVVILSHINFVPLAIPFAIMRPGVQMFLIAHGMEVWTRQRPLRRLCLRLIQQVWAVSEYTASRMSKIGGVAPEKIAVVPNAVLPELTAALLQLPSAPDNGIDVITVGRLWKNQVKGIDHLIAAMATIDGASLVIVGDGDDRGRLEQLAMEAGIASRVTFAGHIDDVVLVDLYRRSRVFALPSAQEGFGLVFLEAMLAGRPVVAADAGAAPEVVRHGETGLLVPYGDTQALARAVIALLRDSSLARELGRRGRERAVAEFGFERYARRVIALAEDGRLADASQAVGAR